MHTVNSTSNGYQVGQWLRWEDKGELHFDIIETFDNKMNAYQFCNYLNGGTGTHCLPQTFNREVKNDV